MIALVLALLLALLLAQQRTYARQQVRLSTRRLESLTDFHRTLLTELDLDRVLERISSGIAPGLGFARATIFLLNRRSGTLHDTTAGRTVDPGKTQVMDDGRQTLVAAGAAPARSAGGRAGLFAPPEGKRDGNLIILPVLGPQPEGARPLCWLEPEERCTVVPRASKATRTEQCPACPNFGPLGLIEVEVDPAKPASPDGLADYARASALAITNARLYERLARESDRAGRRLSQLELIFDVGREVAGSLSVSRVLETLARGLHDRLGYERVSIALADAGRLSGHMTLVNGEVRWTRGISRIEFDIATHPDPMAQVARTGEPLVILDASADTRLPSRVRATVRTVAYVPIIAPADARVPEGTVSPVLGVVSVDHGQNPREIDPSDLEVLTTLGTQVGAAIRNARDYEALAEREQEARALSAVQEALAVGPGNRTPREWLDALCDALAAFAGADFAYLTRVADPSPDAPTSTVGASELGRAAQHALGTRRGNSLTRAALREEAPLV
ncbi:MAG TPA: GAF domain-containing protein, partial [Deinococcales bacterium]|nr:GAF domain-containing protein [Deinococcales bacterium]